MKEYLHPVEWERYLDRRSGRRAHQGAERRTCAKLIRFNADELRLVEERARSSGRPVACYIRESSLGASPRPRRTDLSDSIIRALTQVANRLTPLAVAARTQDLPSATEFEAAVSTVLAVIRDLD